MVEKQRSGSWVVVHQLSAQVIMRAKTAQGFAFESLLPIYRVDVSQTVKHVCKCLSASPFLSISFPSKLLFVPSNFKKKVQKNKIKENSH